MMQAHAASMSARRFENSFAAGAASGVRKLMSSSLVERWGVLALAVIFITSAVSVTTFHALQTRAQALSDMSESLGLIANELAGDLNLTVAEQPDPAAGASSFIRSEAVLERSTRGRGILITDPAGSIIAVTGTGLGTQGGDIDAALGPAQALLTFAARAGVMTVLTPEAGPVLATVRNLQAPYGQLTVVQPVSEALREWETGTRLMGGLVAGLCFLIALFTGAYYLQARRVGRTRAVASHLQSRVDTALSRGRSGLFDWDLARGRIFWSRSMYELLGMEPHGELISFGTFRSVVHPQDVDLYGLADELLRGDAHAIDRAFRVRHASGQWIWMRVRAEVVRPAGASPRAIGICVDVTEERHLAERTVTADLRLRDAVETISEAFVLWDADSRLVLCNSKFQQLYDLDDASVATGTSYERVISAGRAPVVRTQVRPEGRPEEGARTYEAQIEDGRWLHINERRTKDGGFVSVGTDITSLKRHEERLLESEKNQMAIIADLQKTRQALELQAQQLLDLADKYAEQKAEAENANKTKSDFLANISHELRTPLNAIIGFSEIMSSGAFGQLGSPKYEEYCRDIGDSGHYLLDVINDILEISRIESGHHRLNLEEVDLDATVLDALRVIMPMSREKGLALRAEAATGIVARADRRALKQILLNLVSNAVKFTPPGGRVTVRLRPLGGAINIYVEDTGIGIPREALSKLGRPFEQVENQFTKTHKGSGLGLAIARSLVELHDGTMRIRSTVGIGTVVLVRLPLKEVGHAETALAS
jgi:two-component system cell cycle sensor histidine kinase PleC